MAQKVLWLEVEEELFEEALVLRLEGPRSQEGSSEEGVEVEADLACISERAFFCSLPCQCHFWEDLYHLKYVLPYQDFLYSVQPGTPAIPQDAVDSNQQQCNFIDKLTFGFLDYRLIAYQLSQLIFSYCVLTVFINKVWGKCSKSGIYFSFSSVLNVHNFSAVGLWSERKIT